MPTRIPTSVSPKHNLPPATQDLNLELPFLCQIDEQIHSGSESAYWCHRCNISVCGGCYAALATVVGITTCHHCHGFLIMVLGLENSN